MKNILKRAELIIETRKKSIMSEEVTELEIAHLIRDLLSICNDLKEFKTDEKTIKLSISHIESAVKELKKIS